MFPTEFEARMRRLLGAEYDAFEAAADRPRSAGLRLNPLKTDAPPDLPAFSLSPVPWAENGFTYDPETRPGLSAYHEAGLYYLQEPSAMAPAGLLDVRPGMRVLDLCAAPGGKTTQLAAMLRGSGLLVANEYNPKRAQILARNVERLGVANCLVLNEDPRRLAARFPEWFDRILVDAPCSGEGMFRKEDAAVRDWSPETVSACARRQQEILDSAARMLRPGGRLVYSTCTFAPEEDEGVISRFLHGHGDFSAAAADCPWFSPARPDWIDAPAPGVELAFRLWPHQLTGEGHFAAVLARSGDGTAPGMPAEAAVSPPKELAEFRRALNTALPDGPLIEFGRSLYAVPEGFPALQGLKVVRPGLELGQCTKGRFEPAHAWAHWLKSCESTADFGENSPEIAAYLRGETVPGPQSGWTLVTVDGLSLGWAKGSGGVLKNHYPKGLRRSAGKG